MTQTFSRILLISAFAVCGAAHAQKAAETTNTPQRAGEASTMTGGAPNAKTSNETTTATTSTDKAADKAAKKTAKADAKAAKADAKADAKLAKGDKSAAGKASATATSNVPEKAGEASTMTGGVPNKKTTN
jgi:hypothetical protein